MHTRFLLAFLLPLAFLACKQDPTANNAAPAPSANADMLGGQWIAIDFCARSGQFGSVLQAESNSHRPYALALVFNPAEPDSVQCFNGPDSWKMPVQIRKDTVELPGVKGKSIFLVYDSQGEKSLIMFDGISGKSTQMDKFIKSKANAQDGYRAFMTALNHNLFNGTFSPLAAKGVGEKVKFTPGGLIQGWKEFDRYEICISSDCWVMGNEMDMVTLYNSKKKDAGQAFGFKYSNQNDTLSFLQLADATPNEKGGYAVKGTAYKMLRKQVQ